MYQPATDYTPAEVEYGLESLGDYYEFTYENHGYVFAAIVRDEPVIVTMVDSRTGSEGDYDVQAYVVIKVGSQYFRKQGHYMSHNGTDWDGPITEVTQAEKTIKVWENKK